MYNAWMNKISPNEYRRIQIRDLKIISEIGAAVKDRAATDSEVQRIMAEVQRNG